MDLLIADGTVTQANRDTAPTSGTGGWATDGNPAAGIPATDWAAWAWNMIVAELRQALTDNGIVPNVQDWTQISQMLALFAKLSAPVFEGLIGIDGAAGSTREIVLSTAGKPRFVISIDNTPEAGSDASSNISFVVCGDDGNFKFQPFSINRATGVINVNTAMTVTAPVLQDDSATAVPSNWVRTLLQQINWVEVLASTALVPPAWATRIEIMAIGGGGGGSTCNSTGLTTPTSGAGGGGGAFIHGIYPVGTGAQINLLIGTGGASQSQGGDTTIHRTNADGSVDWLANGGAGQGAYFSAQTVSQGGNGGTASGGTIENRNGAYGSDGQAGSLMFTGNGGRIGGGRAGSKGGVPASSPGGGGGGAYDGDSTGKTYQGGTGYQGRVQYRWLP